MDLYEKGCVNFSLAEACFFPHIRLDGRPLGRCDEGAHEIAEV